jgi:hypothetical protein
LYGAVTGGPTEYLSCPCAGARERGREPAFFIEEEEVYIQEEEKEEEGAKPICYLPQYTASSGRLLSFPHVMALSFFPVISFFLIISFFPVISLLPIFCYSPLKLVLPHILITSQ